MVVVNETRAMWVCSGMLCFSGESPWHLGLWSRGLSCILQNTRHFRTLPFYKRGPVLPNIMMPRTTCVYFYCPSG